MEKECRYCSLRVDVTRLVRHVRLAADDDHGPNVWMRLSILPYPSRPSPRTGDTVSIPTKLPPRNQPIDVPSTLNDPYEPHEERILSLLHANDGRLWQRDIVDALDVSKATVSRRLSELETSERISRLEFRGEKIVTLPDRTIQLLSKTQR